MMKAKVVLTATLALCAPAIPSAADAPAAQTGNAGADAFFNRADHRATLANVALDGFKYRFGGCPAAEVTQFLPPQFPQNGNPTFDKWGQLVDGAVKESVIVEGCGRKGQENVATLSQSGREKTIVVTPGATKADLLLMQDTIPYLALALQSKGPADCKDRKVIDTRFEAFEGGPNPKAKFQSDGGRPYRETWTVDACGTQLNLAVRYIPDATGTTIHVEVK